MLFLHQVLDYLNVKNKLSFFPAERTFPTRLQPTFLKSCLATTPSTLISKCSLSPSSQWVQPRPSFSPLCTQSSLSPSQLTVVWQVRPSTGPRSSVNSFPIVKSMWKFLKVVDVWIFMAPVAWSWLISFEGLRRHTIFLRGKLIPKAARYASMFSWFTIWNVPE